MVVPDVRNLASNTTATAASAGAHLEPVDIWMDLFRLMVFLSTIFVAGEAVQLLGGPSLIGGIFTGILLGHHIAHFVPDPRSLILVGEFGLCLLMLVAGFEIDALLL